VTAEDHRQVVFHHGDLEKSVDVIGYGPGAPTRLLFDIKLMRSHEESGDCRALALMHPVGSSDETTCHLSVIRPGEEQLRCCGVAMRHGYEPFLEMHMTGPSHVSLLGSRGGVVLVDIAAGREAAGLQLGFADTLYVRSMCVRRDGGNRNDGWQPEVTVAARTPNGRSLLLHCDYRAPAGSVLRMETHHDQILRVRSSGASAVLTSHARSREVHCWDLRKSFHSCGTDSQTLLSGLLDRPRTEPTNAHRCSGNAPDFDCEHGVVAAISGGAPGTTYGARLHVFSAAPRHVAERVDLPEIVVDDGHRLQCPVGLKLTGRVLHAIADRQRVLRCAVP